MKSIYKFLVHKQKMCEVYPHVKKYSLKRLWFYVFYVGVRYTAIALIVAGSFTGFAAGWTYYGMSVVKNSKVQMVFAEDRSNEIFQTKIEQLKDEVVSDLTKCERDIYNEADGVITYDPSDDMRSADPTVKNLKKILSVGVFQFKQGTVQYYEKLRSGKILTDKEALILALDEKEAMELAKWVGFNTKAKFGGDWKRCTARYNLDARVDIIKSLEE